VAIDIAIPARALRTVESVAAAVVCGIETL
jgi:hypothetical protein